MANMTYKKYYEEFSKEDGQTLLDKYYVIKTCLFLKNVNLTKLDKQTRKEILKAAKKSKKEG